MKLGDNRNRGRKEDLFDVAIPDRHSSGGKGDRPDGTVVHGKFKQPWVTRDGVSADPTSEIDGEGKDVG
jgi:hypothetical protein